GIPRGRNCPGLPCFGISFRCTDWDGTAPVQARFEAHSNRSPRPVCGEYSSRSFHRYLVFVCPYSGQPVARHIANCGYRLTNSTNHGKARWDLFDSIDTTFAARRVTRLDPPVDLCPQIAPPASKADRLPVSLRHVTGFPGLRLLRKLRPHRSSSPIAADCPYPLRAKNDGFPCSDF